MLLGSQQESEKQRKKYEVEKMAREALKAMRKEVANPNINTELNRKKNELKIVQAEYDRVSEACIALAHGLENIHKFKPSKETIEKNKSEYERLVPLANKLRKQRAELVLEVEALERLQRLNIQQHTANDLRRTFMDCLASTNADIGRPIAATKCVMEDKDGKEHIYIVMGECVSGKKTFKAQFLVELTALDKCAIRDCHNISVTTSRAEADGEYRFKQVSNGESQRLAQIDFINTLEPDSLLHRLHHHTNGQYVHLEAALPAPTPIRASL